MWFASPGRRAAGHGGSDRGRRCALSEVIIPLAHSSGAFGIGADDVEDLGWQERALCAQTDPEAFFPEKGGSTREAKKACRAFDVRAECLESALSHHRRCGISGGPSQRERRR